MLLFESTAPAEGDASFNDLFHVLDLRIEYHDAVILAVANKT
jgi:hypothetical protein